MVIGAGASAIAAAVWLAERSDGSHAGRVAELVTVGVIAGLSLVVGVSGAMMAARAHRLDRRRADAEHTFRAAQVELADSLQIARDETEAYALLRQHVQRTVPGSNVVVLRRDGVLDRVEPATFVPDGTALARQLDESAPWSCLAIRLGRVHETDGSTGSLLTCTVCGTSGRRTLCVPAVVGGDVAAAVLVEHTATLSEIERLRVLDSVAQSAGILGGLRKLALAEARSAVDDLTGLANASAVQDNLRRMIAQSGRALSSLSLVVIDLDHLQRINETLGQLAGDLAITAVTDTLAELLRTSDLAGRLEGGELLLVLPDTHKDGALEVAEKVRLGVNRIDLAGLDWPLSASFGVATFPDDAVEATELLRLARAACRAAKAAGRNAVEAAGTWGVDLDAHDDSRDGS